MSKTTPTKKPQRTQADETREALAKGWVPICVHCELPLDVIVQPVAGTRTWRWSTEDRRYGVRTDFNIAPRHQACGTPEYGLMDAGLPET